MRSFGPLDGDVRHGAGDRPRSTRSDKEIRGNTHLGPWLVLQYKMDNLGIRQPQSNM